jgi:4-amino-4-deoxy-L-arabinose transferase-like glycosyltransferase
MPDPIHNQASASRRLDIFILLILFVGGIALRLWLVSDRGFDGLYGQDPYAYYDFAGEIRASIIEGRAPGNFFWPLGYPALLAVGHSLFGTNPATGQIINILMGAALAPLVYILARQMSSGRSGAFTAALLMGISGQALQSSIVIMADIPALFWATLSAVILWRYINKFAAAKPVSPVLLSIVALTLALACITRWLYLALIIPWALALLITWKGRIRWRTSILPLITALIIFIPQLIYSRTNPYPVLNHAWVEGWSPHNIFSAVFDNVDGHFEYSKINGLYYAQPFYDAYYLAPVFTPLLLMGLWGLFRDRRFAALLMLLGWAIVPYLFLAGIPYQNIRFPLIVFPAVAILARLGLEKAALWTRNIIRPSIAYIALVALVTFGASQTMATTTNNITTFITKQQGDKETALWAAERIPEGSTLYTFGLTLTLQHYTTLNVHEIFYETPETLEQKWVQDQRDYLLLNVWNIENQWAGLDPQLDYHWLRDQRGLIMLGKNGYYTLFIIQG